MRWLWLSHQTSERGEEKIKTRFFFPFLFADQIFFFVLIKTTLFSLFSHLFFSHPRLLKHARTHILLSVSRFLYPRSLEKSTSKRKRNEEKNKQNKKNTLSFLSLFFLILSPLKKKNTSSSLRTPFSRVTPRPRCSRRFLPRPPRRQTQRSEHSGSSKRRAGACPRRRGRARGAPSTRGGAQRGRS